MKREQHIELDWSEPNEPIKYRAWCPWDEGVNDMSNDNPRWRRLAARKGATMNVWIVTEVLENGKTASVAFSDQEMAEQFAEDSRIINAEDHVRNTVEITEMEMNRYRELLNIIEKESV